MLLLGRFGPGDSGLHMGAMLQWVELINRGSPAGESNVEWLRRKAGWHTKSLALFTQATPYAIVASRVTAIKGCAVG